MVYSIGCCWLLCFLRPCRIENNNDFDSNANTDDDDCTIASLGWVEMFAFFGANILVWSLLLPPLIRYDLSSRVTVYSSF